MNFSEVTDITIPQGSVTKITDSNNRVLWEKPFVSTTYPPSIKSGQKFTAYTKQSVSYTIQGTNLGVHNSHGITQVTWTMSSIPSEVYFVDPNTTNYVKSYTNSKFLSAAMLVVTVPINTGTYNISITATTNYGTSTETIQMVVI